MKIIIIIIFSLFASEAYSLDLRKLPKSERDKEIRKICKEAVLKYGDSRYWLEDAKEEIVFFASYKGDVPYFKRKSIYIVTYRTKRNLEIIEDTFKRKSSMSIEEKEESVANVFSTQIYIFAKTGEAALVGYGRAFKWAGIFNQKGRSSVKIEKVSYE